MAFVIYNKVTTRILGGCDRSFKTEPAAKAGLTRATNSGDVSDRELYSIAEKQYFHTNIEQQVERTNLMSGKTFLEPINTPPYLSPAYESYWSM